MRPIFFPTSSSGSARLTRPRPGGLGIGLSIVKNLVDLHGGTVRAKSAGVGKGATFMLTLPVTTLAAPTSNRRVAAATSVRAIDADPPSLGGIAVLVIDDDEDSRTLLSVILWLLPRRT